MPYVIAALWKAKPDEEEAVLGLLRTMATKSRQEPGCLTFRVHRAMDDSRTFFLYEVYESEEALQAHSQTDHFRRYVLQDGLNRLESRRREIYQVVEAESEAGP